MKTPAGNDNTSHGSIAAKLTALIIRESFVRLSARSGAAAPTRPSPRLEVVDAANCRQNAEGRRVECAGGCLGFTPVILTSTPCRARSVESIRRASCVAVRSMRPAFPSRERARRRAWAADPCWWVLSKPLRLRPTPCRTLREPPHRPPVDAHANVARRCGATPCFLR